MRIKMGYPSHETEKEILRKRVGDNPLDSLDPVADVSDVLAMQDAVAHVKVDSSLHDYALEIVNRTRKSEQLALGVSPRGTLMLQRAAQARAYLDRRDYCLPDDFKQLAVSVFSPPRCRQFASRFAAEKIGNHRFRSPRYRGIRSRPL